MTFFALSDASSASLDTSAPIKDSKFRGRLVNFEQARDLFLRAEAARISGNAEAAVDGYVESMQRSPDFMVASAMATLHAKTLINQGETQQAVTLLRRIIATGASAKEAQTLLNQLLSNMPN